MGQAFQKSTGDKSGIYGILTDFNYVCRRCCRNSKNKRVYEGIGKEDKKHTGQ